MPFGGVGFPEIIQAPAGILTSAFGWSESRYQLVTATMPHGAGYWVNLSEAGQLTLGIPTAVILPPSISFRP